MALGPPQAPAPSAAVQSRKIPAAVAAVTGPEPALLGPSAGAEPAAARVWPAPSRELLEKRLTAQLHVLGRKTVQEPKTVRGSSATRPSKPAPAEPKRAADTPAAELLAAEVDGGSATLMCEEPSAQSVSATWDSANSNAAESEGVVPEPSIEAVSEPQQSAAPLLLQSGSVRRTPIYPIAIENESALVAFHDALSRLSRGEDPDGKVRILAYGASHTQADIYPGYLRAYLQSRFGNGGRGFVSLGPVNNWHRTLDARMWQRGLTLHHARFKRQPTSEPIGLFGAALVGKTPGSFAEILTAEDSSNTRFELQYHQELGGGDFVVELDGKRLTRITTDPDHAGPAYFAFEAQPGQHRIRVRLVGSGPVRLFGVVAETAQPGIVIDTLGIGGARLADSLRWDDASFIDAVQRRQPDLITLAYGTNEAFDSSLTMEAYEADARRVFARLRRAAPGASCLFIGPFDLPPARRAQLLRIVDAQRRLARENGCGFWDGLAFMGGAGTISSWGNAKPPLAAPDHIHLTRRGYVVAGTAIGDALLRGYDLNAIHDTVVGAVSPAPLK
jgi:lysophospholipase L1-like esterase